MIVKAVAVRIFTTGEKDAELKIGRVAARADELGKLHPEIKIKVDSAAAMVQMQIIRAELRRAAMGTIGGGTTGGAAGGSGLIGTLLFGGGGPGAIVISIGVLAALLSGAGGIIPLLAAAAIGVGSFGALAIPTFTKVTTAVGKLNAATSQAAKAQVWAQIPAQLRPVVSGVLDLQHAFAGAAAQLQPLITKILGVGLSIAGKLLPPMVAFAKIAGTAIDGLLKQLDRAASSPGFKQFLHQMETLAGPAIRTIGQGIGRIAVSVGHLLEALINPNGIRALRFVFQAIGNGIQWVANAINWATPRVIAFYRTFSAGWKIAEPSFRNVPAAIHTITDAIGSWIHAGGNVIHAMGNIGHALGNLGHAIGNAMNAFNASVNTIIGWEDAVARAVGRVIGWFAALPGRIRGALGNLGSLLFSAGQSIISGLISGLQSMLGSLSSLVGSIGGLIAGLKGPITADRVLLYPHGQAIIGGLMAGMNSQLGALAATTAGVTGTVYGGVPGPGWQGGGGGGGTVNNFYVNVRPSPLASPADTGAAVVDALQAFVKVNGAVRLKVRS
jgi:phage-related protein